MKNFSQFLKFIWVPLLLAVTINCSDDEAELKPAISGVSPAEATPGTVVTISGTNLKNISSVKFGSIDAAGFDATANTATTVTATVPAGAATGEQGITLSGPNGRAAVTFTVLAATPEPEPQPATPVITGVTPAEGPAGTEIVIAGKGLAAPTEVLFGTVAITGFTAKAETISLTVPAEAATGATTIKVTTAGGSATVNYTVTPPVPVISSLSTISRIVGGRVSVNGFNLNLVTSVKLGEMVLLPENITINPEGTKLSFTVPEGAVSGKITLITATGLEVVSERTLTVPPPPPFVFSPISGPAGTQVTITGSGFTGTTMVKWGTTEITPVTVAEDGTSIVFAIPAEATAGMSGTITAGTLVSPNKFYVVNQGVVADFDTDAMLKWPQNGIDAWGWGIPSENITNTATGIAKGTGYFGLINTNIAPEGAYANDKVINLVEWSGEQIFPTAPKSVYDPAAAASQFVIKMDIAIAKPASLANMALQVGAYNAKGEMLYASVPLADITTSADGNWHTVSIPLSDLSKAGTTAPITFSTYGSFLAGGFIAEDTGLFGRHLRIAINNNAAAKTDPVAATIAIDNVKIVRAGN